MQDDKPTAIVIQTFNVPAQRVYDAILDPGMIAKFMFGPLLREEEILHIRNEPIEGGGFSFKVRRGADEIDHVGRYLELRPPERIAYTWNVAPDTAFSVVTIDITETPDGCSMKLVHQIDPEWADYIERTQQGWMKMFGVLAVLLN